MKKLLIGLLMTMSLNSQAAVVKLVGTGSGTGYISASERTGGVGCKSWFTGIKKDAKNEATQEAIENVLDRCEARRGIPKGSPKTDASCSCRPGWYGDSVTCYASATMKCEI